MHNIQQRPVARDGEVVIRPMMYVALSYDHRIVDGREAVQFLVRVKELIEDPETLLIEGLRRPGGKLTSGDSLSCRMPLARSCRSEFEHTIQHV